MEKSIPLFTYTVWLLYLARTDLHDQNGANDLLLEIDDISSPMK